MARASLYVLVAAFGTARSDFQSFLDDQAGRSDMDWKVACQSLGQSPAGYGMSMSDTETTYTLTCDSNEVKIVCSDSPFTSCTSDYKPPASAGDSKPTGDYAQTASFSGCDMGGDEATQEEAQEILDYTNKMRCAVGAPAVVWNSDIACQAQKAQNDIGKFEHSKCYDLPISVGENLATGKSMSGAAWMWFLEYLQSDDYANSGHKTGHFTAQSWKSVTDIGCAIQRDGKGVIRCQYKGDPAPNMAGSYDEQLSKFYGDNEQLENCGLPVQQVVSQAKMQQGWGILDPTGQMADTTGLYSTNSMPSFVRNSLATSVAAVGAFLAVVAGVIWRARRSPGGTEDHKALVDICE